MSAHLIDQIDEPPGASNVAEIDVGEITFAERKNRNHAHLLENRPQVLPCEYSSSIGAFRLRDGVFDAFCNNHPLGYQTEAA